MKKINVVWATCLLSMVSGGHAWACTNFIAGKDATADGSVMLTYAADSYTRYGNLYHFDAGEHEDGEMREVIRYGSYVRLGEIPEAAYTYNTVGNMNENQVCIGESTWGGRVELVDSTGTNMLDYGSLMHIALQRTRTAREAINVITSLAQEYGYSSSGESISIIDKNEAWVLDIIGKGAEKGAVWIAVRIPDNAICAHANEPRIRQVDLTDKENVMYAPDMIEFARRRGYFDGEDKDFSFADAYSDHPASKRRTCDARVWAFFRRFDPEMDKYLDWCLGKSDEPMPLYIIPDHKVTLAEMQERMRDHFEDTPLDMRYDVGAGPYQSPYRWRPLRWSVDGEEYTYERPTSTQQTGWSYVAQCRNWLPDEIGGLFWFGTDDANTTVYMPFYCCMSQVPVELQVRPGVADMNTFNMESNFWMNNWVANQTYYRYNVMINDVRRVQQSLEDKYRGSRGEVEAGLAVLLKTDGRDAVIAAANQEGAAIATEATAAYRDLAQFLIVRYMDGAQKNVDEDGNFVLSPEGYATTPSSTPYHDSYLERIVKDNAAHHRLNDPQLNPQKPE